MSPFDRRQFLQISTAALLVARGQDAAPQESRPAKTWIENERIRASGANYSWEWSLSTDEFHVRDSKGRLITGSTLQPMAVVSPPGDAVRRNVALGKLVSHSAGDGVVTAHYEGVNGHARLSTTWRFEDAAIRIDPIVYDTRAEEDVISLHYFSKLRDGKAFPALECSFFIDPGISEGSSVSPIVRSDVGLDTLSWLGRGSSGAGLLQQWGLPVHYFCGFNVNDSGQAARDSYTEGRSEVFCCGLTDLPNGDLFLDLRSGAAGVMVNYRSDLWGHLRGPGQKTLGAGFLWAFGATYYEAIREYYLALMKAGIIRRKRNSDKKTAVALTPQFCTWGAQVARGKQGDRLDEPFLGEIYKELKDSGMRAGMFSIDDKWEGKYGRLEHSAGRLPHFIDFLNEIRADGRAIGLWAAFMRCEDPSDIGLTTENMLHQANGKPFLAGGGKYYLLDFTQPEVEKVVKDLARNFIRRYHPDLVKFDFGYELPTVDVAAPQDRRFCGERLMKKGLEVVVGAMREVNPDIVVMYYQLSPLFLEELDLHSPDDLFLAAGEYDLEANRRFFFSSLMGELGVPTYGSSGYDWQSTPNIWFDSTVVGTLGSLNDFQGDEQGEKASPARIAKYNGLIQVLRKSNVFHVRPLGVEYEAPTRGARSRSWARFENNELVLLAIRPAAGLDGAHSESPTPGVEIESLIRTTIPVVIASRTNRGIEKANSLAVVPYGDGEVSLRRPNGGHAEVTEHWFGGAMSRRDIQILDGYFHMRVKQQGENDAPLEWIDVEIEA